MFVVTLIFVLVSCGWLINADINADIQFVPEINEFEIDINHYEVTQNSVRCIYNISTTFTILWWKDDSEVQITQAGKAAVFQESISENEVGLYFLHYVEINDSGNYTCRVQTSSDLGSRILSVNIIDTGTTLPPETTVPLSTTEFVDTTTQQVTTDISTAYSTTSATTSTYITTDESTTRETTTIPVETTNESLPPTTEPWQNEVTTEIIYESTGVTENSGNKG
uniref:uncharacterized protein LOC120341788 n=1 Tax=Styela clava TaxID=7725 RepID=UPI00193A6B29|nr:uncharacterized protein LOC120341788 [Styela clava]